MGQNMTKGTKNYKKEKRKTKRSCIYVCFGVVFIFFLWVLKGKLTIYYLLTCPKILFWWRNFPHSEFLLVLRRILFQNRLSFFSKISLGIVFPFPLVIGTLALSKIYSRLILVVSGLIIGLCCLLVKSCGSIRIISYRNSSAKRT